MSNNLEHENDIDAAMGYMCQKYIDEKIGIISEAFKSDESDEADKSDKGDIVVDPAVDAVEIDKVYE